MPQLQQLARLTALGGYRPGQSIAGPDADPNTIYRGSAFWVRAGGRLKPTNGAAQVSAQNVGPRIYPLDRYRGEIAGGLVAGKLPKESLVRYQNSALFFVSENVSQQVYINESTTTPFTMTGVTTSATAGKLRVATLSGTTYTARDVGLNAPASAGTVSTEANGVANMNGVVSIVACARNRDVDSTSNPSPASVQTLTAGGNNRLRVVLNAMASGQDGWLFGGTEWNFGNYGPWRVIREIDTQFSVFATNGSSTVTGTEISLTLRPGDRVTINGTQYYIAAGANAPTLTSFKLASDAAGTILVNFPGATGTYTLTIDEVVLDYRNNELALELIEFDNDPPPLLDGIMLFNNVPFGWRGNQIIPSKVGNPEAYPRDLRRSTQSGADIIQALAGDGRIYLLTTNGLEIVTFTQDPDAPFIIRQIWSFGFSSPTQAVVAQGSLFAAIGTTQGVKIVRTLADESPDLTFSVPVESDMLNWNIDNVVMSLSPNDGAVLAMHNNGTDTTILPFMLQQGVWSLPYPVAGRVKDAQVASNNCDMIVYDGTNFRVWRFEAGNGAGIARYACWPFLDVPVDGLRKVLKQFKVIGLATSLYVYVIQPGENAPDVTTPGVASAGPYTLETILGMQGIIRVNIPHAQGFAIRIDHTGGGAEISEISVYGLVNAITK